MTTWKIFYKKKTKYDKPAAKKMCNITNLARWLQKAQMFSFDAIFFL